MVMLKAGCGNGLEAIRCLYSEYKKSMVEVHTEEENEALVLSGVLAAEKLIATSVSGNGFRIASRGQRDFF